MFSLARKMINDEDVASDIVQDVFVYYYEKSQVEHVIENPRSWLLRATINKCIDHSAYRKGFMPLDDLPQKEEPFEDEWDKTSSKAIVRKALRQLKSKEEMQLVLL